MGCGDVDRLPELSGNRVVVLRGRDFIEFRIVVHEIFL
jgi:hypothetical protein